MTEWALMTRTLIVSFPPPPTPAASCGEPPPTLAPLRSTPCPSLLCEREFTLVHVCLTHSRALTARFLQVDARTHRHSHARVCARGEHLRK